MAIYEYSCDQDGAFDVVRPLGTAPESAHCPECGQPSRRVFSTAMLRCGTRPAWTAAMDRADKSRFEPEVVTSLPASGVPQRKLRMTPQLWNLPRP